jgi:hypothetical protein
MPAALAPHYSCTLESPFPASPCDRSHHRISGSPAETASPQDRADPDCPGFDCWRFGGVVLRRSAPAGIQQRAGRPHLAGRGPARSCDAPTRDGSDGGASLGVGCGAVESGPAPVSQSAAHGRGVTRLRGHSGKTGTDSAECHDSGERDRVLRAVDHQRQSGAASDHHQRGLGRCRGLWLRHPARSQPSLCRILSALPEQHGASPGQHRPNRHLPGSWTASNCGRRNCRPPVRDQGLPLTRNVAASV